MPRWGMLLDLERCIGCDACTIACKTENKTPPGIQLAPVYRMEVGKYPTARVRFVPTLCMHCQDPPCLRACPTRAISQRADGIVLVDQDKCCGSRACIAACPYGAMRFYHERTRLYRDQDCALDEVMNNRYQVGTALKCTFCAHRIDRGLPRPACVETCPPGARIFGDLDDPTSEISRILHARDGMAARPEAGTRPSVRYLL